MTGIVLCLSAAAMGVDYGWRPVEGGIEYIIQIEPQLVDSLKSGRDIFSDLPKTAQRVRSYRITVGKERLPHHGEPPPDSAVVPAGGEAAASADHEQPVDGEQEIDLSQLPGPVLRPALTLGEANPQGVDEPRHLAETESGGNRVAGFHEASAQPPADDSGSHKSARREKSVKPSPPGEKIAQQKSAAKEGPAHGGKQKQDDAEVASPSDRKQAATASVSAKPSVLQLGLFTSLACNAFLLWVATGQRSRFRALVQRMFASQGGYAPALTAPAATESPRWEQIDEREQSADSRHAKTDLSANSDS